MFSNKDIPSFTLSERRKIISSLTNRGLDRDILFLFRDTGIMLPLFNREKNLGFFIYTGINKTVQPEVIVTVSYIDHDPSLTTEEVLLRVTDVVKSRYGTRFRHSRALVIRIVVLSKEDPFVSVGKSLGWVISEPITGSFIDDQTKQLVDMPMHWFISLIL